MKTTRRTTKNSMSPPSFVKSYISSYSSSCFLGKLVLVNYIKIPIDINHNYLFSLSIHTGLKIERGMKIKDSYGNEHALRPYHVIVMLTVGWACFLGSWLVNVAFYKFHPSAVDIFSLSDKKKLYVFGKDVFSSENKEQPSHGDVEGEIL